MNGFQYDDRYSKIGDFNVSAWSLQEPSGVISKISQSEGRVPDLESRKNVIYNFYTRPTIPLKLECESQKQEILDQIQITMLTIDSTT